MRFRKIFAVGALPLQQVRHRIQPKTIDSHFQPEFHDAPHLVAHLRIVIIQIGLVAKKTMPVILLRNRIPGPIGELSIEKNDPRSLVLAVGVAPHIPVAFEVVPRTTRFLKPRVLVGSMVQNHFDDDANIPLVSSGKKGLKIIQRTVGRIYRPVIGNVVSVISQRRGEKRHQPDRIDAQILQVVELLRQATEISVAVAAAVVKSPNVDLIDDRGLVPKPVLSWQLSFPEMSFVSRWLTVTNPV